jgi:hypothetical protein
MARQKTIGYDKHLMFMVTVPVASIIRRFQDKFDYTPEHIIFPPTHKITEQDIKDARGVRLMQDEAAGYWAFAGPIIEGWLSNRL